MIQKPLGDWPGGVARRARRLVFILVALLWSASFAQNLVIFPLEGEDLLLGVAVAERIEAALGDALEVLGPEVSPGLALPLIAEDGFVSLLVGLGGEDGSSLDSLAGARLLRDNLGADALLTGRVEARAGGLRATFFLARAGGVERFGVLAPEDEPGLLAQKAALRLAAKLGLEQPDADPASYAIDLSSPYGDYVRALALAGGGFLEEALSELEALGEDELADEAAALRADLAAVRLGEAGGDPARMSAFALRLPDLSEGRILGYFERFAAASELPGADAWVATLRASDRQHEAAAASFAALDYPFGEFAEAAYRLSQGEDAALAAFTDSSDVAVLLGFSLLAQLEEDASLEKAALTRLTEVVPSYVYPFERLSFIAFDEAEPQAAAEALAVATERVPESDLYWTNLGWAYYLLDLFEASEEASLRAVDLDPSQYIALYNLGLVRAVHGRLAEAMEAYDEALALDPEVDDEALLDLENARDRYPTEGAVHYALGALFEQEGRRAEAADAFERYLALGAQAPFAARAEARVAALRAPLPPLEISPGAVLGLGPDLLGEAPFRPGDRVFANFELYTPGDALPSRAELRAELRRDGAGDGAANAEVLERRTLELSIPPNAIGYVVDDLGFELPEDLAAGSYVLALEVVASEERSATLELPLEVAGSSSLARRLLGRGVVMRELTTGAALYGPAQLETSNEALLERLAAELRATADAAEDALEPLESGRFAGLSGGELFRQSTAQDIRDFLEYLLAEGVQDAGFTFVDAYAQWATDGAP